MGRGSQKSNKMTEKQSNKKSIVSTILSVAWWCVLALLFLLLVSILGAKIKGEVPSVFGYSVINIISESMEDEIPQGSYILIKKVSPEEVKRDDIICFYSTDPTIYGMPNTHRVVEDPIITGDTVEFITKGDANPVADTETAKGDLLIGVYVKNIDALTSFAKALEGNTLLILFIVIQVCLVSMAVYSIVIIKNRKGYEENPENPGDKK